VLSTFFEKVEAKYHGKACRRTGCRRIPIPRSDRCAPLEESYKREP
jgi:hypothetical protein